MVERNRCAPKSILLTRRCMALKRRTKFPPIEMEEALVIVIIAARFGFGVFICTVIHRWGVYCSQQRRLHDEEKQRRQDDGGQKARGQAQGW